jgi:hypothetical protein
VSFAFEILIGLLLHHATNSKKIDHLLPKFDRQSKNNYFKYELEQNYFNNKLIHYH